MFLLLFFFFFAFKAFYVVLPMSKGQPIFMSAVLLVVEKEQSYRSVMQDHQLTPVMCRGFQAKFIYLGMMTDTF